MPVSICHIQLWSECYSLLVVNLNLRSLGVLVNCKGHLNLGRVFHCTLIVETLVLSGWNVLVVIIALLVWVGLFR